jgi:DNA polymerase
VSTKGENYAALVENRKSCRRCGGLENPSRVEGGVFDTCHIGPWTDWQGNIDAPLMVVGQDWGDLRYFVTNQGRESANNPTNRNLIRLLRSIGINIPVPSNQSGHKAEIFLTNAILCLKKGGLQGPVKPEWFKNCVKSFLRPLIELVNPRAVVSLGQQSYEAIRELYDLQRFAFRKAVETESGFLLPNGSRYFPMYHCGMRIVNTHRSLEQQIIDWQKVSALIHTGLGARYPSLEGCPRSQPGCETPKHPKP